MSAASLPNLNILSIFLQAIPDFLISVHLPLVPLSVRQAVFPGFYTSYSCAQRFLTSVNFSAICSLCDIRSQSPLVLLNCGKIQAFKRRVEERSKKWQTWGINKKSPYFSPSATKYPIHLSVLLPFISFPLLRQQQTLSCSHLLLRPSGIFLLSPSFTHSN